MAKSYRSLATNSRFLRGISFGGEDTDLTPEDATEAENLAAYEIDRELGTTFSTGESAPPVIRLLADMLGSAWVLDWLALAGNFGEEGEGAKKPEYLRSKARGIFEDLRAHKVGIQNTDGTWNALYPQPDILPTISEGGARPITIDVGLAWGQMAQPVMNDDERSALDPERARRADEAEASIAGSYGL